MYMNPLTLAKPQLCGQTLIARGSTTNAQLSTVLPPPPPVLCPPPSPLRSRRDLPFQFPRDDSTVDVSPGNSGRKHVRDETVGKMSRRSHAAGVHGNGSGLA